MTKEDIEMLEAGYNPAGVEEMLDGGNFTVETCWFCGQRIGLCEENFWSEEWDAYYHLKCLLRELYLGNPEAAIIAKNEWNILD